jgi:hypothetical protein
LLDLVHSFVILCPQEALTITKVFSVLTVSSYSLKLPVHNHKIRKPFINKILIFSKYPSGCLKRTEHKNQMIPLRFSFPN